MASMTVQETRDYVRSFLDADEEELPNSLLDVWLAEGTSRIVRTFEPWDFYESSWTTTTANASVTLNTLNTAANVIDRIATVEAPDRVLRYVPHDTAVKKYAWGDLSGTPWEYSMRAGVLHFWPTPSDSETYILYGHRKTNEASAATDVPDVPSEFHPLLCEWMLARAYEQQDDDIMSNQKFARFEQQLELFRRRYTRPYNADVQSIGENWTPHGGSSIPSRLIYDWE